MGYCTIQHVNSYVPQSPFTSQTTPTQAQVELYIDDVSNELNLSLTNLGYITPVVSGTGALRELRKANAWGALGIAQQARITAVAPDQAVQTSVWTKMYRSWMNALMNPKDPFELDCPRNEKEVVKPWGEMQVDTTALIGDPNNTFDYLDFPPFTMNMKL